MPSQNQQAADSEYSDTDLRILHTGSDLQVTALIQGVSDMARAQKLIKEESMNKNRDWVARKLKHRIKQIR